MQELQLERELVDRAVAGQDSAWREIYDSTSDRLFSFLCYQVGNRDEALDLLQDTYVKAHRSLSDFRGDAPLSAWLRRIALRLAMDWKRSALRKLKRTVGIEESFAVADPEVDHVRFESEYVTLQTALDQLSSNQRAALLLHDWEERSFTEIALTLGCKESTVRVHHARAREKMQRLLGDEFRRIDSESLEGQKA